MAQTELGAPVIIHPGRDPRAPQEIVRVLQEAGGDVSRTVMSHIDRQFHERAMRKQFPNKSNAHNH